MTNSPSKGTVLITGADYADRVAKRGYDLILVGRNEAQLKTLSARLTSETGRSVTPLPADLNDKADLAQVETTLRDDRTITMLVNNAGVGSVAPLLNADVEKMDDMIALNITALTRLAYAAAPAFVARGAGVLINLSSVLALAPERFNASYSATKAYVLNFSLTLHQELSPSGVQVQVVLPGAPRTAIWARAGIEVASLPASRLMEVDEMVDAALVGLDRRELVTIPSLPDIADGEAYTAARLHLGPNLSRNHAADRYKTVDSTRSSRAR